MKLNLYLDTWPGMELKYATASSQKSYPKPNPGHRFKIVVDIPDWALIESKEDSILPVEEVKPVDA